MRGYGITIPLEGIPLPDQRPWWQECADLGFTSLWSAESNGVDAFTPLVLASTWLTSVRLGTSIVPSFTRAPGVMAQQVASLAVAAPGRVVFGLGTSSETIVQQWNAVPFDRPYYRTRDMVRFLKEALSGAKVDRDFDTFSVHGLRLSVVPEAIPPILVAGLRPGMLRMAGREAEGAIINWLSAQDVLRVAPEVGEGKELVCRIFVAPTEDVDAVRAAGRRMIAAYLNVDVYRAFHEWLGRGPRLQGMWERWAAGDRQGALACIDDDLVDELIVHGSPEECRAHIERYVANGVTTPCLALMPLGLDRHEAIKRVAPASP